MKLGKEVLSIVAGLLLALFFHTCLYSVSQVTGNSLAPTLRSGSWVVIEKWQPWLLRLGIWDVPRLKRGDLVSLEPPVAYASGLGIKRVIALAGETVQLVDGKTIVDGVELAEDYVIFQAEFDMEETQLEVGEIFVMGDNRLPMNSVDSRQYGALGVEQIRGRVAFILWQRR